MIWALTEIERSFKETPDDKIIVISSFTSALELFDRYLATKGIRTTRYQGDMKISEREDSIRVLKKSKKCKVMLRALRLRSIDTPHAEAVSSTQSRSSAAELACEPLSRCSL